MKLIPLDGVAWSDARGWGLRPLEAAGVGAAELGDVHVVSVEPGAVRGNHIHPHTTEWMLLFGAYVTVATRRRADVAEEVRVPPSGPTLVVFEPGEAHAVRGEGPGTAYLICYSDGEPVTERVEPLL